MRLQPFALRELKSQQERAEKAKEMVFWLRGKGVLSPIESDGREFYQCSLPFVRDVQSLIIVRRRNSPRAIFDCSVRPFFCKYLSEFSL